MGGDKTIPDNWKMRPNMSNMQALGDRRDTDAEFPQASPMVNALQLQPGV